VELRFKQGNFLLEEKEMDFSDSSKELFDTNDVVILLPFSRGSTDSFFSFLVWQRVIK